MSCLQEVKNMRLKQDSKKREGKKLRAPKPFTPPTLEEVKKYVEDNPELSNVDPTHFWKSFNDSGWIDTKGNPVRNWKLKLRTWSNYDHGRKEISRTEQASEGEAGRGRQATRAAINQQDFGELHDPLE